MINIIALGERDGDISLSGYKTLKKGKKVFCRSNKLLGVKSLQKEIEIEFFDDYFEEYEDFDQLYESIAKKIIEYGDDVCYLTDGSGIGDKVIDYFDKNNISFFPASEKGTREILKYANDYTVISANDFIKIENIGGIVAKVIYIKDVDSKILASDLKLKLGLIVDDEEEIVFVTKNGSVKIPLYELDCQKGYNVNCGVLVFNYEFLNKKRFTFTDLMDIMTRLRSPDGCPWDRAQTHESIRQNTIEEAYEVAEAVDLNDMNKLIEECGDLLLQTVLHSEIAKDCGEFDMSHITTGVCDKLIKRHTHVFGKDSGEDLSTALDVWESNKEKLKGQKTVTQGISDIPKTLPRLMYAQKVGNKVAKGGFDFRRVEEIYDKIIEELEEVKKSVLNNDNIGEEIGDLLFSVCNLSRFLKVDSEDCLGKSTQKFINRFTIMEKEILKDGKSIKEMSDCELDEYYKRAKEK